MIGNCPRPMPARSGFLSGTSLTWQRRGPGAPKLQKDSLVLRRNQCTCHITGIIWSSIMLDSSHSEDCSRQIPPQMTFYQLQILRRTRGASREAPGNKGSDSTSALECIVGRMRRCYGRVVEAGWALRLALCPTMRRAINDAFPVPRTFIQVLKRICLKLFASGGSPARCWFHWQNHVRDHARYLQVGRSAASTVRCGGQTQCSEERPSISGSFLGSIPRGPQLNLKVMLPQQTKRFRKSVNSGRVFWAWCHLVSDHAASLWLCSSQWLAGSQARQVDEVVQTCGPEDGALVSL